MRLIATMPARNEGWVLGASLRVALRWCDAVVLGLHACTDDSDAVVASLPEADRARVVVLRFSDWDWPEMAHRQALLEAARQHGATHIAIVDADEVLTANLLPDVRRLVEETPSGSILSLPGYNLRHGVRSYHTNGVWGRRWFSVAFADDARLGWRGDAYHHREPHGPFLEQHRPVAQGAGGVMHLWGASERRLRAKHVWYRMAEAARWPDKPRAEIERLYSLATRDDGWTFASVPGGWWDERDLAQLRLDAEPWHEAECRRLRETLSPGLFQGLDLELEKAPPTCA